MMHVDDDAVGIEGGLEVAPPHELLLVLRPHRQVDLARLGVNSIEYQVIKYQLIFNMIFN